jgi:DNA-binding transcriptional regulator YdaS (Cro superfamily)
MRRQMAGRKAWNPSDLPDWLNEEAFRTKIQPALAKITVSVIAAALGVSEPYVADIRAGRRCPHPRHWLALARMVGVSEEQ